MAQKPDKLPVCPSLTPQVPFVSQQTASLLLSPVSLYSWVVSTMVRLLLSAPAILLSSLYYSLLLLLAAPWASATFCLLGVLSCLQVALYLLHLGLVVATVTILALTLHKTDPISNSVGEVSHQEKLEEIGRASCRERV